MPEALLASGSRDVCACSSRAGVRLRESGERRDDVRGCGGLRGRGCGREPGLAGE
jgi:hypothetical protein